MAKKLKLPRLANYTYWASSGDLVGSVKIGGQTFQVVGLHAAVHRYLYDLSQYLRQQPANAIRLLPLKEDFREIGACYSGLGLALSLQSNDPIEQRLAVWLLGRRRWRKAILLLRDWPASTPWEVQLEIARALKRLGDWEGLRQLESLVSSYKPPPDLSPELQSVFSEEEIHRRRKILARLRCMTRQRPQRDYQRSLSSFLSHEMTAAEPSPEANREPASLWFQEPLGPGREPKSHWLIRWFLKRIQTAVRG